jgi:hypothetical protein
MVGGEDSTLMLKYGDNLKWAQEKGTGEWYPTFDNVRYKNFNVSHDEIYGEQGQLMYQERADPLRDFYFLSDADTAEMLKNFAGGDLMDKYSKEDGHVFTEEEQAEIQRNQKGAFDKMSSHRGRTWKESWAPISEGGNGRLVDGDHEYETKYFGRNMAPLVDSIMDSRSAIDMIHDYRHSPSGKVGRPKEGGDFWEGSIKLRRLVNEQEKLGDDQWAASARYTRAHGKDEYRANYVDMPDDVYYLAQMGDYTRLDKWTRAVGRDNWAHNSQNDYYMEQFNNELQNLFKAQKQAASSMGFQQRYNFDMDKHPTCPSPSHGT